MMGLSKPMLFLILFFFVSIKLSYCIQTGTILCSEIEKHSLLIFKKSLKDPINLLSSWNVEVDCCKWKGVVCNNSTGHVHQLHLQEEWDIASAGLSGEISPSLLNLKHLTYLNLSHNSFDGQTIPSFIGSFKNLEHLDLSFARFQGNIPHSIGNLSNLLTLSLEDDIFSVGSPLVVDSLEWLSGLSKLEYLGMNGANLSRATSWAKVINSFPSLLEIHLSSCNLDLSLPPNYVNLTSLTFLDLSYNHLSGTLFYPGIPKWLFQLRNLLFLDLKQNYFEGPIPTVSNATKIQYLDLSFNYIQSIPDSLYFCKDLEFLSLRCNQFLEGEISNSIRNLTSLHSLDLSLNQLSGKLPRELTNLCLVQSLDLSFNEFHGELQDSFGNMSDCFLGSLEILLLSRNQFSGKVPTETTNLCRIQSLDISFNELRGDMLDSFGNMSNCFLRSLEVLQLSGNQLSGHLIDQFGEFNVLRTLDLTSNLLSGKIPTTIGNLLSLEELYLGNNNFTGNLPRSLGQLSNLKKLFIGNNKLEGTVTESHFTNLSKLNTFSASRNNLSLNVGFNWTPPILLQHLGLGSWSIGVGSQIPPWLYKETNIVGLDLSNTGISGSIPTWFFHTCFLNLSHNNLHVKIPHIVTPYECNIRRMYLGSNKLSGSLTDILGIGVDTMIELDLSHNSFTGGLSDLLCDTTRETYQLQVLLLEGNRLNGEIPDCWNKWPSLKVLNLGNNTLSGSIPNSIGSLTSLGSLNLYNNKLSGQIPFTMHSCISVWKIDLSSNNLDGNLPTWMGISLVDLEFLILHSNKLSGEISSQICYLQSLQILDLSNNHFSGIIPRCVFNFTAMATKRSLILLSIRGPGTFYGASDVYLGPFYESASATTKGVKLEYSTILSLVTNIDLSNNNLSGDIPKELTSLVELKSLNLSGNSLTGSIPTSIGDMKQLESLDPSRNSLSGQIPNGFKLLSFLGHLNLSLNKLSGKIPEGTQFLGFDASSFIGNNLCGLPLTSNCNGDSGENEENDGNKSEIKWLYILVTLGYAVGFSVACSALVLKKSWRDAYFGWLECIWDKLYVYCCIKWGRLTKPTPKS